MSPERDDRDQRAVLIRHVEPEAAGLVAAAVVSEDAGQVVAAVVECFLREISDDVATVVFEGLGIARVLHGADAIEHLCVKTMRPHHGFTENEEGARAVAVHIVEQFGENHFFRGEGDAFSGSGAHLIGWCR